MAWASEADILLLVLLEVLVRLATARKSRENRGDRKFLKYEFLERQNARGEGLF